MANFKRSLAATVWASHTVTSGEATATTLDFYIASGGSRDDFQFVSSVKRSGVPIGGFDFSYASGTGFMTVANSGAGTLTTGDIVTVIGSFGNLA